MSWPFQIFRQFEYQDMSGETVDETIPVGRPRVFFAKNKIFALYNSKYLRGGVLRSQEVNIEHWQLTIWERIKKLSLIVWSTVARLAGGKRTQGELPPLPDGATM